MKNIETTGDFSFKHYQEILRLAKKQGYRFCFFSEKPDKKSKKIYLRHDIDFSMEGALRLAKIEHKNNVVSTYFVRIDAPFYNVFDRTYYDIIKKIASLGHQIGFHFNEETIYHKKVTKKNIEAEVIKQ